ncbi:MAG: hypothetical protein J3R72DRAFT_429086 [Linnemannia gamsii]|nr:MAG: hypothetical protein J3R72DRAFT_429086 [Linnemannia gamsii]
MPTQYGSRRMWTSTRNLIFFQIFLAILSIATYIVDAVWTDRETYYLEHVKLTSPNYVEIIMRFFTALLCMCCIPFHIHGYDIPQMTPTLICAPWLLALFVLHIKNISNGTTMGFGDECAAYKSLCAHEHINTLLAMSFVLLRTFDFVAWWVLVDRHGSPREWRRQPLPLPLQAQLPLQQQSPQQQQPLQQQQSQPQEMESEMQETEFEIQEKKQSTLSAAIIVNGEETCTEKHDKQHSIVTIDTMSDLELCLHPEQVKVPNPTGFNPGSKPNQEM